MKTNRTWLGMVGIACAAAAISLHAAAPRYMLVHGHQLTRAVVLDDWDENLQFMLAVTEAVALGPGELSNRPYYEFALFWRPEWGRMGKETPVLKSEEADQFARFYPEIGKRRALFVFDYQHGGPRQSELARSVGARGLEILSKHGLVVRSKLQ